MFTTAQIAKLRERSGNSVRQFFDRLPHAASITPHGKTRWTRGDSILCIVAQEAARIMPADKACEVVAGYPEMIVDAGREDRALYCVAWAEDGAWRAIVTGDRGRAAEIATTRPGAVAADLGLIASAAASALDRILQEA